MFALIPIMRVVPRKTSQHMRFTSRAEIPGKLFYSELRAKEPENLAPPDKTIVFLHGILGQGINWHNIAQKFVAARPSWRALLVDLRAHGRSVDIASGSDSIAQCARDVADLTPNIDAILGHSFGGKVALQYAQAEHPSEYSNRSCDVFVVDSLPSARSSGKGSEWVMRILAILRKDMEEKTMFSSRSQFVSTMAQKLGGAEFMPVSQWLSMNLVRVDDAGYQYKLDIPRIENLLQEYFRVDLWDGIGNALQVRTHFVIAGKSSLYQSEDIDRAFALANDNERVTARLIEAGHNVHVDAPQELLDVMTAEILE